MKTAAVICEYNPFHYGHRHQLEQTRALGATHIVAVMSGDFTQRGDLAVTDKFARAKTALENGADLVLELPVKYSLCAAEGFAKGAVGIISALGCVDMLSFGSECGSIPALREAADIDGASPLATMTRIMLPLSKSILIVIILYYMVGHWNSYFSAMMYLRDRKMQPLQVFLREILVLTQMGDLEEQSGIDDLSVYLLYASLKYAIIVVSAVPLLILYPMVQKFFERGIMMGSLKG